MASHKLMNTGRLSDSTADIYDPSSVTGMVKTILFHNTNSSTETVEVYFNNTTEATRMLKVEIEANDTLEWSLGHMIVVLDAEVLKGKSETNNKVNYFIFGAEE